MHNIIYTPTFFTRHNRPLRGVLIDNQPWFAARDIARLVAYRFPHSIHHRFYPHEVRTACLAYSTGSEEETVMLSEAALYKALLRFGHPELEALDRWLTQDVLPTLRDQHSPESAAPRRILLTWDARRLMLLNWQGDLWMRWDEIPQLAWRD
ncbi:BRO-N domain-containing protein [Pseudomonas nitroreducens]|uniref:BRO-N domain-containing protein n=1 Tax=Pseudomonas nitroreducens TaxID=46680 RepID=UPI00209FB603|nr:BRO family protein [Pseudomonas nitroreducens]MCP1621670.1 prophage antirepressor-like protein [Pseudomonas nitroreducens]